MRDVEGMTSQLRCPLVYGNLGWSEQWKGWRRLGLMVVVVVVGRVRCSDPMVVVARVLLKGLAGKRAVGA